MPKDRRHIVDLIEQSNRGWMETLVPIRHGRMMESPFTFYRGSAAVMAADPPLIFHPTAELAAGVETGYREAFAQHREIAG